MPLEARNVSFRYGKGPWILNSFSVRVKQGEVIGLKGPSGCGKSTLSRILAGYLDPQRGSVYLDGKKLPLNCYSPVQLVFQHPEKAVNPRWRLEKTITEGWVPDDGMLGYFGIQPDWLKRWPNELSAGELQRFCAVRALGPQTRFLIADEMTTMLDAVTQAQIWEVVIKIVEERSIGLVVISHEESLLERLCQKNIIKM